MENQTGNSIFRRFLNVARLQVAAAGDEPQSYVQVEAANLRQKPTPGRMKPHTGGRRNRSRRRV